MTLKKQIHILLWLFGVGFLAMMALLINSKGPETTVKWTFDGTFRAYTKESEKVDARAPILKNDSRAPVLHTGSMVFISGVNIQDDSVLMIDNKMVPRSDYTIAKSEGLYFQAPHEGVFKLIVLNKFGSSNEISYEVNNSINVNVLEFSQLLDGFDDAVAWANGVAIPLNPAGQGVANTGVLRSGDVTVQAKSKRTGRMEVIAAASVNKNQKSEGVLITPYTTAKFLIDTKLATLGLPKTPDNPRSKQMEVITLLSKHIVQMQLSPGAYTLKGLDMDNRVTAAVRDIRRLRG